jgi:tetratricopeptide (TPR) repeat protein
LSAAYPGDSAIHVKLGQLYLTWGRSLVDLGEKEAAADIAEKAYRTWDRLVTTNPKLGGYLQGLAAAEIGVGEVRLMAGDGEGALGWYTKAIERLHERIKADGARRFTHGDLAKGHGGRAKAHDRAGRYDDALAEWDEAIEDEKTEGGSPVFYEVGRAATMNRAGQTEKAEALIRGLASNPKTPGKVLFRLAIARAAKKAPAPEDAARVLELLEAAKRAGYFATGSDVRRLQVAPELTPLLERDDFREFVRGLPPAGGARKPPEPEPMQPDGKR